MHHVLDEPAGVSHAEQQCFESGPAELPRLRAIFHLLEIDAKDFRGTLERDRFAFDPETDEATEAVFHEVGVYESLRLIGTIRWPSSKVPGDESLWFIGSTERPAIALSVLDLEPNPDVLRVR